MHGRFLAESADLTHLFSTNRCSTDRTRLSGSYEIPPPRVPLRADYALTVAGRSFRISETNTFASPKSISVLSM